VTHRAESTIYTCVAEWGTPAQMEVLLQHYNDNVVPLLTTRNADDLLRRSDGNSLLHLAARRGETAMLQYLTSPAAAKLHKLPCNDLNCQELTPDAVSASKVRQFC